MQCLLTFSRPSISPIEIFSFASLAFALPFVESSRDVQFDRFVLYRHRHRRRRRRCRRSSTGADARSALVDQSVDIHRSFVRSTRPLVSIAFIPSSPSARRSVRSATLPESPLD